MLPKALKSCPKSKILPNLVTLDIGQDGEYKERGRERSYLQHFTFYIIFLFTLHTHKKAYEKGFRLFFVREIKMKF